MNETHYFLFRDRVLDVENKRWSGIIEKNNVYVCWQDSKAVEVFDWGRKTQLFKFESNSEAELVGRPALEHQKHLELMNLFYITRDHRNDRFVNFVQFTDSFHMNNDVVQQGPLLKFQEDLQSVWFEHGKVILSTQSEVQTLALCDWNHYFDGHECQKCKAGSFTTLPQQSQCNKCKDFTNFFNNAQANSLEGHVYSQVCQYHKPKKHISGWDKFVITLKQIGIYLLGAIVMLIVFSALFYLFEEVCGCKRTHPDEEKEKEKREEDNE